MHVQHPSFPEMRLTTFEYCIILYIDAVLIHFANFVLLELGQLWVAFKVQGDGLFHSTRVQFDRLLTLWFQQYSESRVQS